jgi:hypothetical protein
MRRKQSINKVFSADEAIDRLGGPRTVGELLGGVNERVVWNWRERGFPAHRYIEIRALLRRHRLRFTATDLFARIKGYRGNDGAA